jgi:hypothetical protein
VSATLFALIVLLFLLPLARKLRARLKAA